MLAEYLRSAPWMEETDRSAVGYEVVDVLEFGGASIVIAAHADRRFAVPVGAGDEPLGDDPAAVARLDMVVVDAMRTGRPITTRGGGSVVFQGDPAPYEGAIPFDSGWSTNAVSMIRLGGLPHVHKRYRALSSGVHEPAVLKSLSGTGCLPEYTGDYAYVSPTGVRYPLGVVYRFVDGEPVVEVLRANLRGVWDHQSAEAIARHVSRLEPALTACGATIGRLHEALADRVASRGEFTVASYVDETRALLATVAGYLLADQSHPPHVRGAIAEALRAAVAQVSAKLAATITPAGAGGVCHGDLHLSHLLCKAESGGAWTVTAIDVSPPEIDPRSARFGSQSPWQDLVAVQRGLESLAGHEAAVESARLLGCDRREVVLRAVDGEAVASQRFFATAELWSECVLRRVLVGYSADGFDHPLWRLLYLHRMLHELSYNYARGRAYQVNVDLRRAR